jgi:hypothetical protein
MASPALHTIRPYRFLFVASAAPVQRVFSVAVAAIQYLNETSARSRHCRQRDAEEITNRTVGEDFENFNPILWSVKRE